MAKMYRQYKKIVRGASSINVMVLLCLYLLFTTTNVYIKQLSAEQTLDNTSCIESFIKSMKAFDSDFPQNERVNNFQFLLNEFEALKEVTVYTISYVPNYYYKETQGEYSCLDFSRKKIVFFTQNKFYWRI